MKKRVTVTEKGCVACTIEKKGFILFQFDEPLVPGKCKAHNLHSKQVCIQYIIEICL